MALEPFIISCFLNIYHHNLFPVHWWVIVTAWFLQLCLILCIWLPFAHTQSIHSHNTTTILLLFYIAMLFINYRIHEFKIREFFLRTESFSLNLNNNDPCSSQGLPPPRELDETKIISDYLAEMYSRTPSVTENELSKDMTESEAMSSVVSSVSYSRIPLLHHRQPHGSSQQRDDDDTITSTITNGLTAASETSQEKTKQHNSRKPPFARERSLY